MNYPGFVNGTYALQSYSADCQRTINLFPQTDESGAGKSKAILLATPGLLSFSSVGAGPIRALYTSNDGRLWCVSGSGFYRIDTDGTSTSYGTLLTSIGMVSMVDNGEVIMIVDGPNGYTFDLKLLQFALIVDENFLGGTTVAFQDGYFIYDQPGTQVFWITGLYSTSIDGLDYASAEGSPDVLLTLLSMHRELWLFGANSIEVWYNSGNNNFPFARIDGAFIQYGLVATATPVKMDNTVYWLGKDGSGQGIVYRAQGYTPVRVSTHAMEQEIATYSRMDDATAFSYQQEGHTFYVVNFPSGNTTWVYDVSTSAWHQRAYTGEFGLQRARPDVQSFAFGKTVVGDYQNGTLYLYDRKTYTDAGNAITRVRIAPYICKEQTLIYHTRVQLDMDVGGGGTVVMSFSDDGGRTWSNENLAAMGDVGQFRTRVIWRRLGRSRQRVYQFKITDPVPVTLIDGYIDVEAGNS